MGFKVPRSSLTPDRYNDITFSVLLLKRQVAERYGPVWLVLDTSE